MSAARYKPRSRCRRSASDLPNCAHRAPQSLKPVLEFRALECTLRSLIMVLRKLDVAPFVEQAWFGNAIGFDDCDSPALARGGGDPLVGVRAALALASISAVMR
jgi:hypothetical protein